MKNKRACTSPLKRTLIGGAIAVALAGGYSSVALAGTCSSSIVSAATVACTLTGADSLTFSTSGSLIVTGTPALTIDPAATGVSIDNSGTIQSDLYAIYLQQTGAGTTASTAVANITNQAGGSIISSGTIAIQSDGDFKGNFVNDGMVKVGGSTSNAFAININGNISGSITNTGQITATAKSSSRASATGIWASGDISGSINNSGSIEATASGSGTNAYAAGVRANGTLSGSLQNSGKISAQATGSSASAYAAYVGTDLSGSFTNTSTGTISASAKATTSYVTASAYGVYVGGNITATGSFDNQGTISASASNANAGSSQNLYAYGVDINGTLSGGFNNSGSISATMKDRGYAGCCSGTRSAVGAYFGSVDATGSITNSGSISATGSGQGYTFAAYGIEVNGNMAGSLTNTSTGTISASVHNMYTGSYETVYGLAVWGDLSGTLSNAGTISAQAVNTSPTEYNTVEGIRISGKVSGTLKNTGTIQAQATNSGSSAYAYGVYVDGGISGAFDNSGTISGAANVNYTSSNAYAYGVYVSGTATAGALAAGGSFSNSGSISATANASDPTGSADAYAYGVYLNYPVNGTLTNTSTASISATAQAKGTYATAYASGLDLYDGIGTTGSVTNNGMISASAVATATRGYDRSGSAYAYGLYSDSYLLGSMTNTGTISADATVVGTKGSNYAEAMAVFAYSIGSNSTSCPAGTTTSCVFNNSGTVSATATTTATNATNGDSASAYGVYGYDIYKGASVSNSGTITASATANNTGSHATAYAHGMEFSTLNGTFSNTGNITASATVKADKYAYASAYGLYVSGIGGTGVLNNSGDISASVSVTAANATSHDTAYAYGLYAGSITTGGTLSNSGDISASAKGNWNGNYVTVYAYGIYLSTFGGNVSNTGTITVNATAATGTGAWAFATGISGGSIASGVTLSNDGSIDVSASATALQKGQYSSASASAYGIDVGTVTGTLSNTGSITASADVLYAGQQSYYNGAFAAGIYMNGVAGTVTNSGSINATATSTLSGTGTYTSAVSAAATGIYAGSVSGSLTNTSKGTINVSAVATATKGKNSASAGAWGIYANSVTGTITNDGAITVSASAHAQTAATATATGIDISNLASGGTVINNGSIVASASAQGTTVNVNANAVNIVGGTGDFVNNGTVRGDVQVSSGNVLNTGTLTLPAGTTNGSNISGNYDETGAKAGTSHLITEVNGTSYGKLTAANVTLASDQMGVDVTSIAGMPTTVGGTQKYTGVVNYSGTLSDGAGAIGTGAGKVAITDNSLLYDFTTTVNSGSIDITATKVNSISGLVSSAGAGASGGVATALDGLITTNSASPEIQNYLNYINTLGSAQQLKQAVSQLEPALSGGVGLMTNASVQDINRVMLGRLSHRSGLSSGDAAFSDRNMWIKGYGSNYKQGDTSNISGYDGDNKGAAIGIDGNIGDKWRLGFALATSKGTTTGNNGTATTAPTKIDSKTHQFGVYADYTIDANTKLKLTGALGKTTYDQARQIATPSVQTVTASYDSKHTILSGALERAYAMSAKTTMTPSLTLDYTKVSVDGYTETGGGAFGLVVSGSNADTLVLGIGDKMTYAVKDNQNFLAGLNLGYDTKGAKASVQARFAGGGTPFTTDGVNPSKLVLKAGLGYEMGLGTTTALTASYDYLKQDKYSDSAFSVTFNMKF